MSEPYEWFLKHSLADSVRTVDRTIEITKEGMANAYRSMPGRRNLKVVEYKGSRTSKEQVQSKQSQPKDTVPVPVAETNDTVTKTRDTAVESKVTVAEPVEAPASPENIYIVRAGDTLAKIAKKTGTTVDSLCEKNNITRRTILRIGMRLAL
jgi:LysM repeat protein